jgi:hypothetical protein
LARELNNGTLDGIYIRTEQQEAIIKISKKLLRRIMHVWQHDQDYVYAVVA